MCWLEVETRSVTLVTCTVMVIAVIVLGQFKNQILQSLLLRIKLVGLR
jgi:hypothetical protein